MTIYDLENQDKLLEKSNQTRKILMPVLISLIVILSIVLLILLVEIEKKIYCLFLFCLILILVYICNYVPQLCKKREQDLRENLELSVLHSLGIKKI